MTHILVLGGGAKGVTYILVWLARLSQYFKCLGATRGPFHSTPTGRLWDGLASQTTLYPSPQYPPWAAALSNRQINSLVVETNTIHVGVTAIGQEKGIGRGGGSGHGGGNEGVNC